MRPDPTNRAVERIVIKMLDKRVEDVPRTRRKMDPRTQHEHDDDVNEIIQKLSTKALTLRHTVHHITLSKMISKIRENRGPRMYAALYEALEYYADAKNGGDNT